MRILHLHWLPSIFNADKTALFVWAETSGAQQPKARRRKKPQLHPFIASATGLRQWLPRGHFLERAKEGQISVWLPSGKYGPHPSPGLIYDWTRDNAPPQLTQWHVQGLVLAPTDAFLLLSALNQANVLPHHVKLGSDAAYWLTVTNFVVETLAQQKYRPTLVEVRRNAASKSRRATGYEGRWRAVLDSEADGVRLGQLGNAMPASCRAIADEPDHPPAARALLTDFVDTMLDAGVRQWAHPAVSEKRASATYGDDPVQQWLRALARGDVEVQANAAQLQHLHTGFLAWERTLHVAGASTYRVALRLEAPVQQKKSPRKSSDGAWQLHYLLQARDDASLLVPADEVWKTRGSALKILDRQFEQPQETLLTGLGYAGRYFDPIQRSLKQAKPSGVPLTTQQAFDFLRYCAPQLQRSGFGLLTPPWWNKPGTRLGVQLKLAKKSQPGAETSSTGHMALQNLIHYRWELSLGDTVLTREEFDALVRLKSPLVQIRGQWVQLDPEQIEAAIRFYENQALEGDVSMLDALGMGLGDDGGEHAGLPVDSVEFDAWLQEWLGQMQGDEKMVELPVPQGLHATLRPYQRFGYSWIDFARRSGTGVILADDMGLGKTIQTLSFVQRLKEERGVLDTPFLLIAPTSVVTKWAGITMQNRQFALTRALRRAANGAIL